MSNEREARYAKALEAAMGCKQGPLIDEQYGHACLSRVHIDALNNGGCDFARDLARAVANADHHD